MARPSSALCSWPAAAAFAEIICSAKTQSSDSEDLFSTESTLNRHRCTARLSQLIRLYDDIQILTTFQVLANDIPRTKYLCLGIRQNN
jgi:hypothetical protein